MDDTDRRDGVAVAADLPPDATYRQLPMLPFETVKADDEAKKPAIMQRAQQQLEQRYDLADRPIQNVMMSGARNPCRPAFA